ncbi:MAG TPA: hypothetical protein VMT76_07570 [Puia sp.]|nr:hypothetical protein [Puia sp.]
MKLLLLIVSSFFVTINTNGQHVLVDSTGKKESFAIAELGGEASFNFKERGLNVSPTLAVEVTPIENWLELELGITPNFESREWDIDILFKKPWDFSQKVEFMFGAGLVLEHSTNNKNMITNSLGGEIALDFMFWPFEKKKFGWYLEPAYDYSFGKGHEQSIGMSGGLLISIR